MISAYSKGNGRFGNQFFRNMYAYFLSEKLDIGRILENPEHLKHLGIEVENKPVRLKGEQSIELNEADLLYYLSLTSFPYNGTMSTIYCQTKDFARYLIENFPFYQNVWNFNPYKERYGNNDDVYVHYRIGDLEGFKLLNPFEYYDQVLQQLLSTHSHSSSSPSSTTEEEREEEEGEEKKRRGFIASDSPQHPNVKRLVEKYNLEIISCNLYETILFGSTCKHIVLSLGTFSWLTGFLSQESSEVYYLEPEQVVCWHGKIFQAFEGNKRWHKIELEGIERKYFNPGENGMHKNNYTFAKDKIYFLHLEKTGGTSIINMNLPQIATYKVHQPISYNCPPSEGYQYFTVFRNPYERVWSFFKMATKDYGHFRKYARNPEGFIRTIWEVQNYVTRCLAGYTPGFIFSKEEMFRRAKENMEKLVFIIDFDHFEEDLKKFIQFSSSFSGEKRNEEERNEKDKGKGEIFIPHSRKRSYDTNIPFNIRKVIEEHNQYDIELYKYFIKNKQKYQPLRKI